MGISKSRFYLLLGALACAISNVSANVAAAENCISNIPGLTSFNMSNPGYAPAALPFNRRLTPSPAVVTVPQTVPQIQSIVKCASSNNVTVSARSGGHSYAAYALSGTIVVDMSKMKSITLNPDNTAVVQTGNHLGDLALTIFNEGKRALPHGSCPYVGTGGHTLYGGFGYFGRIGGLLVDTVVSADVVLADGSLVTLNSTSSDAELFAAIRGGGPSYGLVVSWTYQTLPAPPTTVKYAITFPGSLAAADAATAYASWQTFIENKPDEFAAAAVFGPSSQGRVSLEFDGNYYGTQDEALTLLQPFVNALPSNLGASLSTEPLGWLEGLEAFAGGNGNLNTSLAPDGHDTFYAKSLITTSPSSKARVDAFVNYMAMNGSRSDTAWFVQVDLYGGKIARVGNGTSFDHRSAFLVYQFYASSENMSPQGNNPPYPMDGIAFVNGIVRNLDSSAAPPGYPNYIDPILVPNSLWKQAYFPTKADHLQSVKDRVDPHGVFDFPEGF